MKGMTREEENKLVEEWIEENGVTRLPPDERIKMSSAEVWKSFSVKKKTRRGRKKAKK